MHGPPDSIDFASITFFNDSKTSWDFVTNLLVTVFGKSPDDANAFATKVHRHGKASLGPFPPKVAEALYQAAQALVEQHGQPLLMSVDGPHATGNNNCNFCGKPGSADQALFKGNSAQICDECLLLAASNLSAVTDKRQFHYTHQALSWHFAGIPKDQIVSTSRAFPGHMRADVQLAVNELFASEPIRFFGVHEEHRYETMTLSSLMKQGQYAPVIAPAEYVDLDTGEDRPVKCLRNGAWLRAANGMRYAAVLSEHREFRADAGIRIEIGVPAGEQGVQFTSQCFKLIEDAVHASRSYRGKVLSLEANESYSGKSTGMTVHRLPPVTRSEVILPDATLNLLDRNIINFVKQREGLRALGQSTRKGILLYGPPGTGKTHTIRYLAANLPGHTTLLITAAEVGLLAEYMMLARLLQPSMVVIEDVDLIARDRERMSGPCDESMLNRLLNEMDGLKGDADIIFILTTNRPEQLEHALAGRPGRVDQAIEIPLPDSACRSRLVHLYGGSLRLGQQVVAEAARRSDGVSAAFIKELMRRTAQANIERGGGEATVGDVEQALEDMLFTGGKLNIRLLGAADAGPA